MLTPAMQHAFLAIEGSMLFLPVLMTNIELKLENWLVHWQLLSEDAWYCYKNHQISG